MSTMHATKEIGWMICNMEKVKRFGKMDQRNTMENSTRVKSVAKVSSSGTMAATTKATSSTASSKDSANTISQT